MPGSNADQERRQQRQHRDQVEHALDDDRGERGGRAQPFAPRQQIRPDHLAGARRQHRRGRKADDRRAKRHAEPRRARAAPAGTCQRSARTTNVDARQHQRQQQQVQPRRASPTPTPDRDRRSEGKPRQADGQADDHDRANDVAQIISILPEVSLPETHPTDWRPSSVDYSALTSCTARTRYHVDSSRERPCLHTFS